LLHFKKVTGIDIDHSAVEKANDNCSRMSKKGYTTPFSVTHADASHYRIPGGINLVLMSNPFGQKTMELVVENIVRNTQDASKELYVIYFKPVHQDVFSNYKECIKVYERVNRKGTNAEMVIFKICHNQLHPTANQLNYKAPGIIL
jgi:predicted RNA methylase